MEQGLSRRELAALERAVGAVRARPGTVLFDIGSIDEDEIILLDGELELRGGDGLARRVRGGDATARMPLARLRPRQYRAEALSQIRYLRVGSSLWAKTLARRDQDLAPDLEGGTYEVAELLYGEGDDAQSLFIKFAEAVAADRVHLPSLPTVAVHVRQAINADVGARELARIINNDAAIATKILRTANSPLYRGANACATVNDAVARIGINNAQQVVTAFAMQEVFNAKAPALKQRMAGLWRHTQSIASGAFVLARSLGLRDSEGAMLAGLLHDIGAVAVLAYVEGFPNVWRDEQTLGRVLDDLKGEAGAMLLGRWGFDASLVRLPKEVDDWQRESTSLDACGLLQITHYCVDGAKSPPRALTAAGVTADELAQRWAQAAPTLKAVQSLLDAAP